MGKKNDIQISIKDIKEKSFHLSPIPIQIDEISFGKNLTLGIGFKFDIDPKGNLFYFDLFLKYIIKGSREPIIKFETEIVFKISDVSSIIKPNSKNKIKGIDINFLTTVFGVCIGTTRGLLAANLKDNPLSKFPLPILNPKDLLKSVEEEL